MVMEAHHRAHLTFTLKIVVAMFLGVAVGVAVKWLPLSQTIREVIVEDILTTGGQIFISLLKMLVVPIVFVSLVCGSSSLGDIKKLGRIGGKTVILYLFTTALAVALALSIASLFGIGHGITLKPPEMFTQPQAPNLKEVILNIFPSNPFKSFAQANMLQVIVFALLFGIAIAATGKVGKKVADLFESTNHILMKFITLIMKTAPYGVFCLLAALFAKLGFGLIREMLGYFMTVLVVLVIHLFFSYGLFLRVLGRLSPWTFFRKMRSAMLFAFSVSSSNASIPIVLKTVEEKLGVGNSVAAFVIPLGATINMDGTAIMQGVATVFIAHVYNIDIGFVGYLTVVLMATLASIGTAGVPSVGLITLAMVLEQVGLPAQGIALIIGIDRLLDMARTAVNISGDAMVSCLVAKSEKDFDLDRYTNTS